MAVKSVTFHRGGVHPLEREHHGKTRSQGEAIRSIPTGQVVLPLANYAGAPAKPLVKKGDTVRLGQKIAEAGGYVGVPYFATVSGRVLAVENRLSTIGTSCLAVVIENDGKDELDPSICPKDYRSMEPAQIVKTIQEAGIVGMGGAAFPTHVKLTPPPDTKVDCLILNGAECEPYLTCDHRVMLERADRVVEGCRILMRALSVERAYIGVENNKMDAIQALEKALGNQQDITVAALKVKYPQGAEKQLIQTLTGRTVESGALPASVGCVVSNVGTAAAIAQVFATGLPCIERVVTVTGPAIRQPGNLQVRLGTSFETCIEACGGLTEDVAKILSGGPMTGFAQATTAVPVMANTSGIVALTEKELLPEASNCIRCGKCLMACPMGINARDVALAVMHNDLDRAIALHAVDCIGCGSCSYICPAMRPLMQNIKLARAAALERARKKKA